MRFMLIGAVVALLAAGNANAGCKSDLLSVSDWSVTVNAEEEAEVAVTLASSFKKPTRMIDASVVFEDTLGQRIGQVPADSDESLAVGASFDAHGSFSGTKLDRAAKLARNDVKVTTCVRGVVYEDGTKEEFK
ncbi:hypothetical protein [Ensifer sp. 1H6]|uniref:hypothetical protein n=1 Tax=Ensifer sp. 1H6 TaxID=1911585 RepID=UPI0009C5F1F2|nr:hypothetical protein [Ensifer sp. 1H6]OMQ42076.1 hypothetical protein BKP54_25385 [Ensifer sp. 1H6]